MSIDRSAQCELKTTTQTAAAVTSTQSLVLAQNPNRRMLIIQNIGANEVYVGIGHTPTSSNGIYLAATGGSLVLDRMCPTDEIRAICSAAESSTLFVAEYQ